MSTAPMILFTNATPDVFQLSDIYDPTIHGTDYLLSGKQIPSVNSLVVDNVTSPGSLSLWVVESVHPTTRKSTIIPIRLAQDITDRVISYGNEMLCVYYETVEGINGYRLTLDSKLLMLGSSGAVYILYRRRDSEDTVISNYINEDGDLDGHYVPLQTTDPSTGFQLFQSCVTGERLVDGDVIIMQVYTIKPGDTIIYELVSEYQMIAKEAHQLMSLSIGQGPILGMEVTANQMTLDGKIIIYRGQAMSELVIYPYILYANGYQEYREIDNESCYAYGLDDVNMAAVDSEFDVTIKCFLPDNYPSPLASGQTCPRSVSKTMQLVVKTKAVDEILKVSPIPYKYGGVWTLKYVASRSSRSVTDVCDSVAYIDDTSFNPATIGTEQHLVAQASIVGALGDVYHYTQNYYLTLFASTSIPWWIVTDPARIIKYGSTTLTMITPKVQVSIGGLTCTIPASVFSTSDVFIEQFYTNALPPKLVGESVPPVPTHFNLRYPTNYGLLNAGPISIWMYADAVHCNPTILVNSKTVIVEFVKQVGESMTYLYAVPAVVEILP